MTDPETSRRFDRLEGKIDKLTEVLASVARVEEKLIGTDARLKRHEFRLDENEKKIEEVAETALTNQNTAKIGTAIIASLWTAILGYVAYLFRD
jgi:phage shock protein A